MKLEFERQLEETKAKQQPVEKANQIEQRTTKLPKLQITKFNGTYEAWLPFWNKFQAEIDKANLASVTKFAYLKELVDPRVRSKIDGLPFTTEGFKWKVKFRNIADSLFSFPTQSFLRKC